MFSTLPAVVRNNKIELLEEVTIPDGTHVLVTLLAKADNSEFWQTASHESLDAVWNYEDGDVYAQILKK